jgi:hypothetical protein
MPAWTSTRDGYLQSSIRQTGSLLALASRSGFECGQSGVVLLASGRVTVITSVTTIWEGVLDLWSGHARLLPCLWCELKEVLRIFGDSGDGDDKNHGARLMEVLGPTAPRTGRPLGL